MLTAVPTVLPSRSRSVCPLERFSGTGAKSFQYLARTLILSCCQREGKAPSPQPTPGKARDRAGSEHSAPACSCSHTAGKDRNRETTISDDQAGGRCGPGG